MSGIGWRQGAVWILPRGRNPTKIVLDENDSEVALPEYHTNEKCSK